MIPKKAAGMSEAFVNTKKVSDPNVVAHLPTSSPPATDPSEAIAQKGPFMVFACFGLSTLLTKDQNCSIIRTI